MHSVTVYTVPSCVQCDATKKWLNAHDIPFATVDLSESPESMAWAQSMGFHSAPIVTLSDPDTGAITDHWSGFRLDRIRSLEGAQ